MALLIYGEPTNNSTAVRQASEEVAKHPLPPCKKCWKWPRRWLMLENVYVCTLFMYLFIFQKNTKDIVLLLQIRCRIQRQQAYNVLKCIKDVSEVVT